MDEDKAIRMIADMAREKVGTMVYGLVRDGVDGCARNNAVEFKVKFEVKARHDEARNRWMVLVGGESSVDVKTKDAGDPEWVDCNETLFEAARRRSEAQG